MTGGRPAARLAVAAAFSLGFLWQAYGAVSNLLAWAQFAALFGRQLSAFAWAVLVLGLLIPVVVLGGTLVLGRRRRARVLALMLLVALCASQALGVSQLAFFLAGVRAL